MKKLIIPVVLLFCLETVLFAEAEKPILTVLDFDASEISLSEMKSIINVLSSGLFQSDLFTVIDVAQRETVLNELAFSMSGCTDDSCMLEVGKLLSAELIVGGSISRMGSKIVLSAKIIETETSKTVSTADGVYKDMDDLLEGIYEFRDRLSAPYMPESAVAEEDLFSELNIPAVATAAGAAVGLGAGIYFLAVSLPLLFDYTAAWQAYESGADGADFNSLFTAAEAAQAAAIDGNANANFIIGASLAGLRNSCRGCVGAAFPGRGRIG